MIIKFKFFMIMCVLLNFSSYTFSQEEIVIRLILGDIVLEQYPNVGKLFEQFEEEYPDVEIVFVKNSFDSGFSGTLASLDIDRYLAHSKSVSESADVFYINSFMLESERTISGSLLNMSPLLRDDPQTQDFFYSPMLDNFRWDDGVWALPVSVSPAILYYRKEMFDDAGLAYPDSSWQLDDFSNALQILTIKDGEGSVVQPALLPSSSEMYLMLLRALSNVPFYNPDFVPNPPQLDKPEILSTLQTLLRLTNEGSIMSSQRYSEEFMLSPERAQNVLSSVPMGLTNSLEKSNDNRYLLSVLPNGYVGMSPVGYAISSGTQHPEIAYALVRFIATDPALAAVFQSELPVSPQFYDMAVNDAKNSNQKEIIDASVVSGLPYSEARYWSYLLTADTDEQPIDIAIQQAQTKAFDTFQQVSNIDVQLAVDNKSVNVNPDTTLFIGIKTLDRTLSNRDRWLQIEEGIVTSDTTIESVEVISFYAEPMSDTNLDCIITDEDSSGFSRSYLDMQPVITTSTDPLLADTIDILYQAYGGTLTGIPVAIDPSVLIYDNVQMTEASLTIDGGQWSHDTLNYLSDTRQINLQTDNFADVVQLLIMFGAVTDDQAIQHLLDWNDERTIEAVETISDLIADNVITSSLFNPLDSEYAASLMILDNSYLAPTLSSEVFNISFLPGNEYTPVSFNLWSGYIASGSPKLEQCLQFFHDVSEQYDLIGVLPATYDGIRDAVLKSDEGLTNFIERYEETLLQSNVIFVPRADSSEYRVLYNIMLKYIDTGNRDELARDLQDLSNGLR